MSDNGRVSDHIEVGVNDNAGEVIVGNEQYAGEPGTGEEANKGPDSDIWPVENRDLRRKENRPEEDPDYVGEKGPDPREWPAPDGR
jgi:hypothetical protein